jgi:hypothetical protein
MATSGQYSAKIPTTSVWDPSTIPQNIDPILKELFIRMYQNLNLMANVLNVADIGFYNNQYEFVNGQQYFANPANNSSTQTNAIQRPVFRTVVNFGALPNGTINPVKSVPHNIPFNGAFSATRIYAAASDTTGLTYIPIPFASPTLNQNIKLDLDAVNVNITTGAIDRSNYNLCYVVIEILKF